MEKDILRSTDRDATTMAWGAVQRSLVFPPTVLKHDTCLFWGAALIRDCKLSNYLIRLEATDN